MFTNSASSPAGNDIIFSAQSLDVPQRVKPADSRSAPAGSTALAQGSNWRSHIEGSLGKGNIQGGGGGDIIANPLYSIAAYACYSGTTARLDCEIRHAGVNRQQFQSPLKCSNSKSAHAHSARLAEHKWLGRRMGRAQTVFYVSQERACT